MRYVLLAALLAWGLALGVACAEGRILKFRASEIPAKTEAGRILLKAEDVAFPANVIEHDAGKRLIQIDSAQGKVWVRESDVETADLRTVVERKCLNGEIKLAQSDTQLGATQMGAAKNQCASEESSADVCRAKPAPPWCAERSREIN